MCQVNKCIVLESVFCCMVFSCQALWNDRKEIFEGMHAKTNWMFKRRTEHSGSKLFARNLCWKFLLGGLIVGRKSMLLIFSILLMVIFFFESMGTSAIVFQSMVTLMYIKVMRQDRSTFLENQKKEGVVNIYLLSLTDFLI